MRNHLKNIEELTYLINKYCDGRLKNELLDTVKNHFAQKYIFYNLSDSNIKKEDKKIYHKIIGDYI